MTNQIISAGGVVGRSFSGPSRFLSAAVFRASLPFRSRVVLLCPGVIGVLWDFSSPLVFRVPGVGVFLLP